MGSAKLLSIKSGSLRTALDLLAAADGRIDFLVYI